MDSTEQATQGKIYFNWNGGQVSPWGGLQASNPPYNTLSVNGRLRGTASFVTQSGRTCCQMVNAKNPNPSLWPLQAVTLTRRYQKLEPATRAYGLAFYIPANFTVPNAQQEITMLETRFVNIGGHGPLTLSLWPTGVRLDILSGAYNPSTRQYQYASGTHTAPEPWPIPQGSLAHGQWNLLSWQVRYAADKTGSASYFHKTPGGVWQAGGAFSGVPTALWTQGQAIPTGCADLLNNYGRPFTAPFTTWYGQYIEADFLSDVQALMP